MHDFYTPRFRWEHTQDEVLGWYEQFGFADGRVTEVGRDGFGVVGTRLLNSS
jgi:hypothetical protein